MNRESSPALNKRCLPAVEGRDQNVETGELPEIVCVVGHEDKISIAGAARDIPIIQARAADIREVAGRMARLNGDGDQVNAEVSI